MGTHRRHDWVVKLDPDTAFVAARWKAIAKARAKGGTEFGLLHPGKAVAVVRPLIHTARLPQS